MATELNSSITESPLQTSNLIKQGAEARVYEHPFEPIAPLCIIKERFRKSYRIAALDERLTRHRVTTEARCLVRLRRAGLDTPRLYHVDVGRGLLYMEFVKGLSVRDYLVCETAAPTGLNSADRQLLTDQIAATLAKLHSSDLIHGDLTTSNMIWRNSNTSAISLATLTPDSIKDPRPCTRDRSLCLIDFGLSYQSALVEDKGVDLYVLERAFLSAHPNLADMFADILKGYTQQTRDGKAILKKLEEVRMRGRKKIAFG